MAKPIEVWPFGEAPQAIRDALFDNGGDEDWLAIIPPEIVNNGPWPTWLDHGSFGCCCINRYAVAADGTLMQTRGEHDALTDCLKWEWLYDRPKFPDYAGYEFRVGCHS